MPDLRNRAQLEQEFAYGISLALNRHRVKLVGYGLERIEKRPESEWQRDEEEIAAALILLLQRPYLDAERGLATSFGLIRSPREANADFLSWAGDYARKTAERIVSTNKKKAIEAATVAASLAPKFDEPFKPTPAEVMQRRDAANLSSIVDVRRAAGIAVTEVTTGISAGEEAAAGAVLAAGVLVTGAMIQPYAVSERDGKVCPVCRAKHGKRINDGEFPPFHNSCRCWVDWRII